MPEYERTQPGTLMRTIFGGGTIIAGGAAVLTTFQEPSSVVIPSVIAIVLVACLFLFHSLTVSVSRDDITLKFGIGLIWKHFAVRDVQDAGIVSNRWYYGWGVRLTPHGWLYNVSGFDAVEITLRNGRTYRIGTDEPLELLGAIESAVADSREHIAPPDGRLGAE